MPETVDLPAPETMWSMLAGWNAVLGATLRFLGRPAVSRDRAHHDDGGGSEFDLVFGGDGRAVIIGFDRHFGEIEGRGALLANGAAPWWFEMAGLVSEDRPEPSFVYGYADKAWTAAGHSREQIVHTTLGPGTLSDGGGALASLDDFVSQACEDAGQHYLRDEAAIRALFAAGAEVGDETLRRAMGGDYGDRGRGIALARTYRR